MNGATWEDALLQDCAPVRRVLSPARRIFADDIEDLHDLPNAELRPREAHSFKVGSEPPLDEV